MKVVAGTGHRPTRGDLSWTHTDRHDRTVRKYLNYLLEREEVDYVIVGGSQGYDTLLAWASQDSHVPYGVYLPFRGYGSNWPSLAQIRLEHICNKAKEVKFISPGDYEPWKMHCRNEAMVDDATDLWAYFDGIDGGGTHATITYAQKVGVNIRNILEEL